MDNNTKVTTTAMGGALAILVLVFCEPLILEWRGGVALPMGVESAFAMLFTVLLSFVLPSDALNKIARRTKPPSSEIK